MIWRVIHDFCKWVLPALFGASVAIVGVVIAAAQTWPEVKIWSQNKWRMIESEFNWLNFLIFLALMLLWLIILIWSGKEVKSSEPASRPILRGKIDGSFVSLGLSCKVDPISPDSRGVGATLSIVNIGNMPSIIPEDSWELWIREGSKETRLPILAPRGGVQLGPSPAMLFEAADSIIRKASLPIPVGSKTDGFLLAVL